jgi:heme-degrading monooxygenase HmoA
MILEAAMLHVLPGREAEFEAAFREASPIIAGSEGYLGHELRRCIEAPSRYLLLVRWRRLEDHTEGFRGSPGYQRWRALLHHFYDPSPTVEHFEAVPLGE